MVKHDLLTCNILSRALSSLSLSSFLSHSLRSVSWRVVASAVHITPPSSQSIRTENFISSVLFIVVIHRNALRSLIRLIKISLGAAFKICDIPTLFLHNSTLLEVIFLSRALQRFRFYFFFFGFFFVYF